MRPQPGEYPAYFGNYIPLVRQDNVLAALKETKQLALELMRGIDPAMENFAYAPGKWTIKQVFIHCTDTDRIFATRALGFARGETQKSLPFDENVYADHSHPEKRTMADIMEEYECASQSTILMFKSFSEEQLQARGEFPSGVTTVNSIGFTTCGHMIHHMNVIKERYLKAASV